MGTSTPRFAVVAALAALTLTACSEPGTPQARETTQPGPTTTTTKSKPAPTTKSSAKPPVSRPKTIDLKTVDPCVVARESKLRDLGIDQKVDGLLTDSDVFPGSKSCTVSGEGDNVIVGIDAVLSEGVESFTSSIRSNVEPITIDGFPAARFSTKPTTCWVLVDTNDGQMMYFQILVGGRAQPVATQQELCAKVTKVAETGMKVLLTH